MTKSMNYKAVLYHLERIKVEFEKEHLDTESEALDIAIFAVKNMILREDDGK